MRLQIECWLFSECVCVSTASCSVIKRVLRCLDRVSDASPASDLCPLAERSARRKNMSDPQISSCRANSFVLTGWNPCMTTVEFISSWLYIKSVWERQRSNDYRLDGHRRVGGWANNFCCLSCSEDHATAEAAEALDLFPTVLISPSRSKTDRSPPPHC